ncbi:MAG: guanylate kinase [Ruminococcus sp.]|nr:guanylate kinase [Ruminococcus sp.]
MKNDRGLLFVVSAPSGCGKGTILYEILQDKGFYYSVSATTRAPREGEVDGVNYHFLSREQFDARVAADGMLEYATYCGNSYGTPRKEVEEMLDAGKNVILEIDVQGAMQVKERCPEAILLFIAPPSVDTLRHRLEKRGTETAEVIAQRVAEAEGEIACAPNYHYIIVNDVLEVAVSDFRAIVRAEQLKVRSAK